MSIKLKALLSAALVLGSASAALAASKHPARHTDRTTVQRNVVVPGNFAYPGGFAYRGYNGYGGANAYPSSYAYPGYNGFGGFNAYALGSSAYAAGYNYDAARDAFDYYNTVPRGETYIYIQDKFFRQSN